MANLTHEDLAAEHALGNFEALHPTALGYVNLTLKRMIARGLMAQEQINEDLIQEANLAALESCRSWVPWQSTLGSWAEIKIRSAVQDYLRRLRSGMVGGRDVGYTTISASEPLSTEDPDDPATLGESLRYSDPPEELGDPFDEVVRLQEQKLIHSTLGLLCPEDRELVCAVFGVGQRREAQEEYANARGIPLRSLQRQLALVRVALQRRGK